MWTPPSKKAQITVGIDPDVSRSGVVIRYDMQAKTFEPLRLHFFDLYDKLVALKTAYGKEAVIVRIEAGWLNAKSNFHGHKGQSKNVGERIAKNVGANHEAGKKIVEMCLHLDLKHETVKPTSAKWTSEYAFSATGVKTRNQEIIDALKLVA